MDKIDNEKHFAELLRLKVKGVINRKKNQNLFTRNMKSLIQYHGSIHVLSQVLVSDMLKT